MSAAQKSIAIVQSNYIPWKGYFDLIGMVDEFILYDTVQYTTRDWRNRNRIKTPRGAQWLTIPVQHGRREQTILETRADGSEWRRGHWKTIQRYYAHAGYWKQYSDELEALYLGDSSEFLSEINRAFLGTICGWLNIHTPIRRAQDYALPSELRLSPSDHLIALLRAAGASDYLSGPAARSYLDQSAFDAAGIRVHWMDYGGYPEYRQLWPPFVASVSILDLILNEGPAAHKFMKYSSTSGD
ncbi:MAG: WbqC family protein [bacterium]